MSNAIIDLTQAITRATTADDIWGITCSYLGGYGYENVNCAILLNASREIAGVFSNMSSDWMEHYVESEYFSVDPIVNYCLNNESYRLFNQKNRDWFVSGMRSEENIKRSNRMFDEVAEEGIRSSLMVPFHSKLSRNVVVLNAGNPCRGDVFKKEFYHKEADIVIGASILQMAIQCIDINNVSSRSWYDLRERNYSITSRERDVLKWLASGLRNERIAERMGISVPTVNFHVISAKRKLDAKTREQAVAIAIYSGLIDP